MNEGASTGSEAHEVTPTSRLSREEAYENVVERLKDLLEALDEALEAYNEVSLPEGNIEAENDQEKMLSRAQTLHAGVEGLLEQMREKDEYYAEEATALVSEAVKHVTEFLAVRTDLMNRGEKSPEAAKLAGVLDQVIATLLKEEEEVNDDAYIIDQGEKAA